ncbi:MAG: phosphoribosylamine--glycine ligase [Betaproteobacteria bacterium]
MKVLVIGSGGREHALAWKLAQSPRVQKVVVAPGNAGTAREPGCENIALSAISELVRFAQSEQIAMTVVGPEGPLADGIVDAFRTAGLRIFGPTRAAAQLESSKDFAKAFMARHRIPTARHQTFSDADAAHAYVDAEGAPIVIKADGLAAGKGVVVALTLAEAHAAIAAMLTDRALAVQYPEGTARVVIEEFMAGEEASFIAMVDGRHVLALATSQDHKRLGDGDRGPNTGGMGAYSPAPVVTPAVHNRVMHDIIRPTVDGMAREGLPFTGFLYAGLMIDPAGNPRVVEFNARLGDPEAEVILFRLNTDLYDLFDCAIGGRLDTIEADWDRRSALTVVLAAAGYPESPKKGARIEGLGGADDFVHVFHAGTVVSGRDVVVNGGRVLAVTALGDPLRHAQRIAYDAVERIRFDGMQFRLDIGHHALKR